MFIPPLRFDVLSNVPARRAELGGRNGQYRSAQKAASMLVYVFEHFDLIHGEFPKFNRSGGAPEACLPC